MHFSAWKTKAVASASPAGRDRVRVRSPWGTGGSRGRGGREMLSPHYIGWLFRFFPMASAGQGVSAPSQDDKKCVGGASAGARLAFGCLCSRRRRDGRRRGSRRGREMLSSHSIGWLLQFFPIAEAASGVNAPSQDAKNFGGRDALGLEGSHARGERGRPGCVRGGARSRDELSCESSEL